MHPVDEGDNAMPQKRRALSIKSGPGGTHPGVAHMHLVDEGDNAMPQKRRALSIKSGPGSTSRGRRALPKKGRPESTSRGSSYALVDEGGQVCIGRRE